MPDPVRVEATLEGSEKIRGLRLPQDLRLSEDEAETGRFALWETRRNQILEEVREMGPLPRIPTLTDNQQHILNTARRVGSGILQRMTPEQREKFQGLIAQERQVRDVHEQANRPTRQEENRFLLLFTQQGENLEAAMPRPVIEAIGEDRIREVLFRDGEFTPQERFTIRSLEQRFAQAESAVEDKERRLHAETLQAVQAWEDHNANTSGNRILQFIRPREEDIRTVGWAEANRRHAVRQLRALGSAFLTASSFPARLTLAQLAARSEGRSLQTLKTPPPSIESASILLAGRRREIPTEREYRAHLQNDQLRETFETQQKAGLGFVGTWEQFVDSAFQTAREETQQHNDVVARREDQNRTTIAALSIGSEMFLDPLNTLSFGASGAARARLARQAHRQLGGEAARQVQAVTAREGLRAGEQAMSRALQTTAGDLSEIPHLTLPKQWTEPLLNASEDALRVMEDATLTIRRSARVARTAEELALPERPLQRLLEAERGIEAEAAAQRLIRGRTFPDLTDSEYTAVIRAERTFGEARAKLVERSFLEARRGKPIADGARAELFIEPTRNARERLRSIVRDQHRAVLERVETNYTRSLHAIPDEVADHSARLASIARQQAVSPEVRKVLGRFIPGLDDVILEGTNRHRSAGRYFETGDMFGLLEEGAMNTLPEMSRPNVGGWLGRTIQSVSSTERQIQQVAPGFELMSRNRRYQALRDFARVRNENVARELSRRIRNSVDSEAFSALAEGKIPPAATLTPENKQRVDEAVQIWKVLREGVFQEGRSAGLSVGRVEDYLPHAWPSNPSPEQRRAAVDFFMSKRNLPEEEATRLADHFFEPRDPTRNKTIEALMGRGMTNLQAENLFQQVLLRRRTRMAPNLEMHRFGTPGYVTNNIVPVIHNYLDRASDRILQARIFGPKDEILDGLLTGIRDTRLNGNDSVYRLAVDSADLWLNRKASWDVVGSTEGAERFYRHTRAITSAIGLTIKTALLQSSQMVQTAAYGGILRTIGTAVFHPVTSWRAAQQLGAMGTRVAHPMLMETVGLMQDLISTEKVARAALTPVRWADRYFRGVSAVVADAKMEELLGIASRGRRAGASAVEATRGQNALRVLAESGADIEGILQRGVPTQADRIAWGRDFVRITNIEPASMDLPRWWWSGGMRTVLQFKSFLFGSARGTKRILINELQTRGPAHMSRAIATLLIGGFESGDVVRILRNRIAGMDPDRVMEATGNPTVDRILNAWSLMGTIGLASSLIETLSSPYLAERALTPPAAGIGFSIFKDIQAGNIDKALRRWMPSVSILGQEIGVLEEDSGRRRKGRKERSGRRR